VRIEIVLDVRVNQGLTAPWQIFVDSRRTEPSLTTTSEVIECLMRLGVEPEEAQRQACRVTRDTPYCQFDLQDHV
jgi:hypothetical protein